MRHAQNRGERKAAEAKHEARREQIEERYARDRENERRYEEPQVRAGTDSHLRLSK